MTIKTKLTKFVKITRRATLKEVDEYIAGSQQVNKAFHMGRRKYKIEKVLNGYDIFMEMR